MEWAGTGAGNPIVVFGPEGCGKTAWLRQAAELLREEGFEVIYVDPLHKDFLAYTDVKEAARRLASAASEAMGIAEIKLAALAVELAKELLKLGRRRVAILVDEVFQAIGLDKAGVYVKTLLNLIEYPPKNYEKIVAIAATSEGASRKEIGRHRWADLMPMWNMSREGFEELYEKLPGLKPDLEEAWKLTGGNPHLLKELYRFKWDAEFTVEKLVDTKGLTDVASRWKSWLAAAIEDPDYLWGPDVPRELVEELVEKNLIVHHLFNRDPRLWIDEPPPERDTELGIGRYVAWQTPLHREAVRKALAA